MKSQFLITFHQLKKQEYPALLPNWEWLLVFRWWADTSSLPSRSRSWTGGSRSARRRHRFQPKNCKTKSTLLLTKYFIWLQILIMWNLVWVWVRYLNFQRIETFLKVSRYHKSISYQLLTQDLISKVSRKLA